LACNRENEDAGRFVEIYFNHSGRSRLTKTGERASSDKRRQDAACARAFKLKVERQYQLNKTATELQHRGRRQQFWPVS
jgi:hypothetical protein